ncbi:hypothetical protein LCGC14_2187660, partial [marine sediment metagenome]
MNLKQEEVFEGVVKDRLSNAVFTNLTLPVRRFGYSPRMIFLSLDNSSNISSLSELSPPPASGAVSGASPGGTSGLFACAGGPEEGGPEGGPEGGNTGAGGKPGFFGGPLGGPAFGG